MPFHVQLALVVDTCVEIDQDVEHKVEVHDVFNELHASSRLCIETYSERNYHSLVKDQSSSNQVPCTLKCGIR